MVKDADLVSVVEVESDADLVRVMEPEIDWVSVSDVVRVLPGETVRENVLVSVS